MEVKTISFFTRKPKPSELESDEKLLSKKIKIKKKFDESIKTCLRDDGHIRICIGWMKMKVETTTFDIIIGKCTFVVW